MSQLYSEYVFDDWTADWMYDNNDYNAVNLESSLMSEKTTMDFHDLLQTCIIPTVFDICSVVCPILCICLCFHFSYQCFQLNKTSKHLLSGFLGIGVLFAYFQYAVFHSILLMLISYLLLCTIPNWKYRPEFLSIIAFAYLVYGEFKIERKFWQRIHNVQMIMVMKVISVMYDVKNHKYPFPKIDEFFGYIFCVGNCLFGPWVTFSDYQKMYKSRKWEIRYILIIVKSVLCSLLFFMMTMCITDWLIPETNIKLIFMYKGAFEFKTSHYFVTFLSEAFALASGLGCPEKMFGNDANYLVVSKPLSIEFPRSLTEIVVLWNVPMHRWFKNYVFSPVKAFGKFPALVFTYLISSLLHGMSYQLSAVLLSLSFYTYIEYVLRIKLSVIADACILSKRCNPKCTSHRYKSNHPIVIVVNIFFGTLALFHLNYLAYLINMQDHELDFFYSFEKWVKVGYCSHILAACTYLFYLLL